MTYGIEQLFDRAAGQLDREDRRLQALENARTTLQADKFDSDGIAAMSRALTYVICGGLLEQLMRDLPQALARDIMALGATRSSLPIGFLAAMESASFNKCTDRSVSGIIARVKLLSIAGSHLGDARVVDDFSEGFILADGHTIGVSQFEAIWQTLELGGDWWNDSSDILLLRELRSKRNQVAHWEDDPVTVGKSRTYSDLRIFVRRLRNLLDHFCLHICGWLDAIGTSRAAV